MMVTMTSLAIPFLLSLLLFPDCQAFLQRQLGASPLSSEQRHGLYFATPEPETSLIGDNNNIQEDLDEFEKLMRIARLLKLEIFDLDEGIYGYDTQDSRFGLEVVRTTIDLNSGGELGIELTEMASAKDGRGLVLVSGVYGAAAKAEPRIRVGDAPTGVLIEGGNFRQRLAGFNYDLTVEGISEAKAATIDHKITLEVNRLVERAPIQVEVVDCDGKVQIIDALAGENLRRMLMRKNVKLYNRRTRRFDMPYATGDCAGEGLCGTCLVKVEEGMELLNPKENLETMITKGRPLSWRTTCRVVVGADNQPGKLRIVMQPQSQFEDEINPGVRPLN